MINITDQSKQALIDKNILLEQWGDRRWELLNRLNSAGDIDQVTSLALHRQQSSHNPFSNAIFHTQIRSNVGCLREPDLSKESLTGRGFSPGLVLDRSQLAIQIEEPDHKNHGG